jgi:hypothetical protein
LRGLAAARIADPLDRLRDAYGYEVGLGPELARPNWVRWAELVRLGFHDAAWRERAAGRLRDWCEYDAALIGQLAAAGRVAPEGVDACVVRLVATLNGAGMLWMLGVLPAERFAVLVDAAIDDEVGIG